MNNELIRIYRQSWWILFLTALIVGGFGILTVSVEGVTLLGVVSLLIAILAIGIGAYMGAIVWLQPSNRSGRRWWRIIPITIIMLASGVIGHETAESPTAVEAHACIGGINQQVLCRMIHRQDQYVWWNRYWTWQACLFSVEVGDRNFNGRINTRYSCYLMYYPGAFPHGPI